MQPHQIAKVGNKFGTDQDGGRLVASSATTSGLRCFVQPGKAQTLVETDDKGNNSVVQLVMASIYFVDDAQLKVHDLLEWVDSSGTTHNYLVVGYWPPCGTSVCWHASCEERI